MSIKEDIAGNEEFEKLAHSHYQEACRLFNNQQIEDAIDRIDQAISLSVSKKLMSVYYAWKAKFLLSLGRKEAAKQILQQAIELFSNNVIAWMILAGMHYDSEEFVKAAECLKKEVAIKPNFNSYTLLAKCELEYDPQAALDSAEKALSINPEWDEAKQIRDTARQILSKS